MKKLTATLCLTLTLLLGSAGMSWSADFQKGLTAARSSDFATALREWKPLAEQGNADAQGNLGLMYEKGDGVPQDYKTAVKWYKLAAKQGYASAQFNLGGMYEKGDGVPQDYKTAVKWWKLAAEQGYASAQNNLGLMYVNGTGVLQDYARAHMWWNIASISGENKNASKNRDLVAKKMTPSQIETAQKLARECVRKKYKGC
jgi:TPR repeat protein